MPADDRPAPFLPVLLAWLVPGAGHLRLGRPWPALFIAGAIVPLFVGGMILSGYENVSLERHPWYFVAHAGASLPAVLATWLTQDVQLTDRPPHQSVGQLYTAMAGLLNLVAIADCWARCKRGDPEDAAAAAEDASQPVDLTGPDAPAPEAPLG